jgi:hypothetical protein
MGRELGRISGSLLADNLKRNGTNLAFATKVLYLDVVNNLVSFNSPTSVAGYQVYTPNSIDTVSLIVDNSTSIGNFTLSADSISHATSSITISPNQSSNPTIAVSGLATSNLNIRNNTVSDTVLNDTINISPTGGVVINGNTLVSGNLHATGNITFDGNITLGNNTSDNISLTGEIITDIIPTINNTYNLGSASNSWNTIYANSTSVGTINQNSLTATTLNVGDFSITSNSITVSANNDLNLVPNGSGNIKFNGFSYVVGSTINNPVPSSPFILKNTGDGYTKITGPGFVIPYGTSNNYPTNPEMGTMRFNETTNLLEIFNTDSASWVPVVGTGSQVTTSQIQQIVFLNELILGF